LNNNYYTLLEDPRWQKKRLRIFKRDGYKCTVCGRKQRIEVHHTFYYSDHSAPWEYPDNSLLTLCNNCHKEYHEFNEIEIKERPKRFKKDRKKFKRRHKNKQADKLARILRSHEAFLNKFKTRKKYL